MDITNLGFRALSADEIGAFDFNPFGKIGNEWFLVTGGNSSGWNTMTASWGFAGVIWNKNSFITVLRPTRYTKEFVDNGEYFTACFFPEDMKKALVFCGSHSGRDSDKAAETGLKPVFFEANGQEVTAFEQASLIVVCRKVYAQQIDKNAFIDKSIDEANYNGDYHTQYIGEITAVYTK